jgi:hypothetical protein
MYSFQSPLAKKRTVVFIAAQDGDALVRLAEAATIGADVGRFQGDFVSLAGETITSLQVADAYHVGELPLLTALQWNLAQRPWSTPTLMGLSFLLVSFGTFGALQRRARSLKEADEGAPESE